MPGWKLKGLEYRRRCWPLCHNTVNFVGTHFFSFLHSIVNDWSWTKNSNFAAFFPTRWIRFHTDPILRVHIHLLKIVSENLLLQHIKRHNFPSSTSQHSTLFSSSASVISSTRAQVTLLWIPWIAFMFEILEIFCLAVQLRSRDWTWDCCARISINKRD